MNMIRRQEINSKLEQIELILEEIDCLRDDEQDSFYNLPENLQGSEKGETMEGYIDSIDTFKDEVYGCVETLRDEVINN